VDAQPVRVVVADDDPLVRRALRDALQDAQFVVVGAATNGREAVELALHYSPDVVVMDVVMPGLDGVAATKEIRRARPAVRVLLIAGTNDEELAVIGLHAGASGFMRKQAGLDEISAAVRRTAAGEPVVDTGVVGVLIERLRAAPPVGVGLRPVMSTLTDREWEVLDGLCLGLAPEQLAEAFVVSIETVRTHVKSIYRKLGVHSQGEAVAAAAELRRPSPAVAGDQ
jgi:two-component system nitrate/nitrite response regulator NarL